MGTWGWIIAIALALPLLLMACRLVLDLSIKRNTMRMKGQPLPELDADIDGRLRGQALGMLYFYTPEGGACQKMTPHMEVMARDHDNVVLVDVTRDAATPQALGVMGCPTVVLIDHDCVADIRFGPLTEKELEMLGEMEF